MPIGMTVDSLTRAAKHLEQSALHGITDTGTIAVLQEQAKAVVQAVHLLAEAGDRLRRIREALDTPMLADLADDPVAAIHRMQERAEQAQFAEDALCTLHAAVIAAQPAFEGADEGLIAPLVEALRAAAPLVQASPANLIERGVTIN